MKATIRFDHELLAVESEHRVHAMLELVAPAAPQAQSRAPLHLALVIDRSGSMAGAKLHNTKRAAAHLIQRLSPDDEVALVVYDDAVDLLAPLDKVHPERMLGILDGVWPGGSTNLSGGWLKGVEEVRRAGGDGPEKVLLLTDGLANVGVTDPAALVDMARQAATKGVGTTTIGFGDGFDEDLLTALAEGGTGNAHYAASPEDAPGIFAQEFEDLASIVAQNLSVEIRPSTDVEVLGVLNDHAATAVPGGLQLAFGDAYGGERRRVVFQLGIPGLARLGPRKVADIVLRYVTVGDEIAAHETALPLNVNLVSAAEASGAAPDKEVAEEVLVLRAARAQKEARDKADHGDYSGARRLLTDTAQVLRSAAPNSARADELLAEASFLEGAGDLAAPGRWSSASSKSLHYNLNLRRQSRRREPRNQDESR